MRFLACLVSAGCCFLFVSAALASAQEAGAREEGSAVSEPAQTQEASSTQPAQDEEVTASQEADEESVDSQPAQQITWVVTRRDERRIYIGDIRSFSSPCQIKLDSVFEKIDYYAAARKAEKGSAQYWIYMTKANKVFKRACKDFLRTTNYDLVCEAGTLGMTVMRGDKKIGDYSVPDETAEFLEILQSL